MNIFIPEILSRRLSKLSHLGLALLLVTTGCSLPSLNSGQPNGTRQGQSSVAEQVVIKAGGSSSAVGLLQVLADGYKIQQPGITLNLLEAGQSENAIAAVKQKIIDFAAISKKLKPEENDGTLIFKEVAHDGLLVATHKSVNGVTALTTDQLKGIYSGSITNWKELGGPDAPIVVLDRPEDESAKRLLRKHYLGKDLVNAPSAIVLRKEGELIQALQNTPYSVGAFSLAHFISHKLPINPLSLNNISPTIEMIKNGQYKMVRTIGLVWHQSPSKATQGMIEYLGTADGQKTLETAGYVVILPR